MGSCQTHSFWSCVSSGWGKHRLRTWELASIVMSRAAGETVRKSTLLAQR